MKLIRLVGDMQRHFVEFELLARFDGTDDEDDPRVVHAMAIVAEHWQRSGGTALAVPDAEVLRACMVEAINGISDNLEYPTTLDPCMSAKESRRLMRSGEALCAKLK